MSSGEGRNRVNDGEGGGIAEFEGSRRGRGRGGGGVAALEGSLIGWATPAAVISIFAQWGLSQLVTGLLFLASCVRYRSLIPLMCLVFIAENIGRVLIGAFKPLPTEHSPPGAIGSVVFFLVACGVLVAALHPSPRCAPLESPDSVA